MKKIVYSILAVVCVWIVSFQFTPHAMGNDNGAPAGRTGSPGDGGITCANTCHTGTAVTAQAGWITSNIPVGGYVPGTTYQITATATYSGRIEFGYEISPQDAAGNLIGTMTTQNGQSQLLSNGKYITHTNTGTAGTNSKTWTFNWTAPVSGTGSFTFYGAFNASNSNNQDGGDIIYTSTLAVNEQPTTGLDCGIFAITSPISNACDSLISPVVKLQNFGTDTLHNVDIQYFMDANTPATYHWTGVLTTAQSQLITLPTQTVTVAGSHTFTATTANPDSTSDVLGTNDSKSVAFNLIFTGSVLPFSEGFEATAMPPAGWVRNNPDGSTTWSRVTSAHSLGVASAKMDNYNYNGTGQRDDLITPPLDLTSDPNPTLTFDVAYRLYTNPASSNPASDTLTVYISTDCGATWTIIYKKYSTALTTITPAYSTSPFTPTATQWRNESVSLMPYQACAKAYLKFQNTTSYENNLYLDNIYINGPAAINSITATDASFDVFPNPANGNAINLNYELSGNANVSWQLMDLKGSLVAEKASEVQASGQHHEQINISELHEGMYLLRMTVDGKSWTKKITVTK